MLEFSDRLALLGIFALVLVTSGCISVESDIYISEDAEIDRMDVELGMDSTTYNMMGEDSEESLAEELESDIEEEAVGEEGSYSDIVVTEEERDGRHYIGYEIYDPEMEEDDGLEIYEDNGHMIFEMDVDEDTTLQSDEGQSSTLPSSTEQESTTQNAQFEEDLEPEFDQDLETQDDELGGFGEEMAEDIFDIQYNIHMPGEIVETNGEIVEETTASYDMEALMEIENEGMYVESEIEEQGLVDSILSFFTELF